MRHFFRFSPGSRRLCRAILAFFAIAGASPVFALRVVITNDDGFESSNLQALFTALKAAGHDVIMSAPYRDQSGASAVLGATTNFPVTAAASPGGKVPAGSPGVGPTTIAADQFYVNSSPSASALYGIDVAGPAKWGGPPDLLMSGPNIGNNLGLNTPHSGTVGAAITALNRGVPALAVSGANGDPATAALLAQITLRLVAALDSHGKIALPAGIGLNVNLPVLSAQRTAASYPIAFTQIVTPLSAANGPAGETNAIRDGNTVTVSPIQGTFQAPPDQAVQVLAQLRPLLATTPTIANPQLINVSARTFVGTGANVQIAGFIVTGHVAKNILIRASGPGLAPFGIANALADPTLDLFDGKNQLVATNDNWGDDPVKGPAIAATAVRIGTFAWTAGSRDAALLVSLPPGNYTAVVRGVGETTGVALLEAFDVDLE